MLDYTGEMLRQVSTARGSLLVINSVCMSTCANAADISLDKNFADVLQSNVNASRDNVSKPTNLSKVYYAESKSGLGNIQSRKKKQVDSATLAKRWNIDQKKALKTVKLTTQRGIWSTLHPSLSCQYPTNDHMIRYNRLPHLVFSDTLKYGVLSK